MTVDQDNPVRTFVLGIESGSFAWTLSPVRGGEQVTARGSFVTIWRRDSRAARSCHVRRERGTA